MGLMGRQSFLIPSSPPVIPTSNGPGTGAARDAAIRLPLGLGACLRCWHCNCSSPAARGGRGGHRLGDDEWNGIFYAPKLVLSIGGHRLSGKDVPSAWVNFFRP